MSDIIFKNTEEFSCVVMERKKTFSELSLLEIIVSVQEEYELEDSELMKLMDSYMISAIENEATKNKLLKQTVRPLF